MGKKIHVDTVVDFLSLQETLEMSGLEYMTAILKSAQPRAPISRVMGYGSWVARGKLWADCFPRCVGV